MDFSTCAEATSRAVVHTDEIETELIGRKFQGLGLTTHSQARLLETTEIQRKTFNGLVEHVQIPLLEEILQHCSVTSGYPRCQQPYSPHTPLSGGFSLNHYTVKLSARNAFQAHISYCWSYLESAGFDDYEHGAKAVEALSRVFCTGASNHAGAGGTNSTKDREVRSHHRTSLGEGARNLALPVHSSETGSIPDEGQDSNGPRIDDQEATGKHDPQNWHFACPFFLHNLYDPNAPECPGQRRIGDVRQHLFRKHKPPQCPVCSEAFENEAEREMHIRVMSCTPREIVTPGITQEQWHEIKAAAQIKSRRTGTDVDRWYTIWDIVFPGKPRPISIYVVGSVSLMRMHALKERFLEDRTMELVRELLPDNTGILDSTNLLYRQLLFTNFRDYINTFLRFASGMDADRWPSSGTSPNRGHVILNSSIADTTVGNLTRPFLPGVGSYHGVQNTPFNASPSQWGEYRGIFEQQAIATSAFAQPSQWYNLHLWNSFVGTDDQEQAEEP